MADLPPVPMRSPVLEALSGNPSAFVAVLHREMVRFLNELRRRLGLTTSVVGSVSVEGEDAAITTTDIPMPPLDAGTYRAAYSLHVSRAATTSSACGLTFGWTTGGVSCSQVFNVVTGNTLASQSSDAIEMQVDAATAITYAVSYSSVGAQSMTYDLEIQIEVWP